MLASPWETEKLLELFLYLVVLLKTRVKTAESWNYPYCSISFVKRIWKWVYVIYFQRILIMILVQISMLILYKMTGY